MFDALFKWLGRFPGGIAHASIGACTIGSAGDSNNSGISGSNSNGSSSATDNSDSTGNTVGTGGSATSTSLTISGVAATGAPLLGARIRVIDSAGKAINLQDAAGTEIVSDSSSTADGSFRLTVAKTAKPVMPLLLQARGQDASGRPVVLHSLLPSGATVANITPLTDAALAQLLGANPALVLQNASTSAGPLTILAIGDSATLSAAMSIPGGVIDSVSQRGAVATVSVRDHIEIRAVHTLVRPRFAKPVPAANPAGSSTS